LLRWSLDPLAARKHARTGRYFHPDNSYSELGRAEWDSAWADLERGAKYPVDDAVLADAHTFMSTLRYDMALFFSAMAFELMLHAATRSALKQDSAIAEVQCDNILIPIDIPQVIWSRVSGSAGRRGCSIGVSSR